MSTDLAYCYAADIVKSERDGDGDLLVYGKATGSDRDGDGQRCDPDWLKTAMPGWFTWGNVREMHQPVAAGVGIELTSNGDDWYVKSKVIDPNTAKKIEAKALKGYSIGVKSPYIDVRDGQEWIAGGEICEISYVDRPCLPTAKMMICKVAGGAGTALQPVEVADAQRITPADVAKALNKTRPVAAPAGDDAGATLDDALVGLVRKELTKRKFTTEEREQAASDGEALTDGSYPIKTVTDLRNAIRRVGTGKNPAAARAHIKRRAKALNRPDLIPEAWRKTTTEKAADTAETVQDPALLADIRDGLVELIRVELDELCDGEFELYDIEQLLTTLRLLMAYWSGEAAMGETASPYETKTQEADVTVAADTTKTATTAPVVDVAAAEAAVREAEATLVAARALVTGTPPPAADPPAVEAAPTAGAPPEVEVPATETTTAEGAVTAPDPTDAGTDDTTEKVAAPDPDTRLAELVKSAIADAIKPSIERIQSLEADLAKALALPEPGGPVITRTAAQAASARETDQLVIKTQIGDLLTKADLYHSQDRLLAQGYRDRAAKLAERLTA